MRQVAGEQQADHGQLIADQQGQIPGDRQVDDRGDRPGGEGDSERGPHEPAAGVDRGEIEAAADGRVDQQRRAEGRADPDQRSGGARQASTPPAQRAEQQRADDQRGDAPEDSALEVLAPGERARAAVELVAVDRVKAGDRPGAIGEVVLAEDRRVCEAQRGLERIGLDVAGAHVPRQAETGEDGDSRGDAGRLEPVDAGVAANPGAGQAGQHPGDLRLVAAVAAAPDVAVVRGHHDEIAVEIEAVDEPLELAIEAGDRGGVLDRARPVVMAGLVDIEWVEHGDVRQRHVAEKIAVER